MHERPKISKALELVAQLSIDNASRVFSKMVKTGARIELVRADVVRIDEVSEKINAEDREVMGAFIDLEGEAPFKFLFYTDALNSLTLAELMLRKERESMKDFEVYARSAVQEIANILASSVANVFSLDLAIRIKPTPPMVVHDFVGAIFAEYIMSAASQGDDILMIESKFCIVRHDIRCHMFVFPMKGSEQVIVEKCSTL